MREIFKNAIEKIIQPVKPSSNSSKSKKTSTIPSTTHEKQNLLKLPLEMLIMIVNFAYQMDVTSALKLSMVCKFFDNNFPVINNTRLIRAKLKELSDELSQYGFYNNVDTISASIMALKQSAGIPNVGGPKDNLVQYTKRTDVAQFIQLNLSNLDLHNLKLKFFKFPELSFANSNLENAHLHSCKIKGANFNGANVKNMQRTGQVFVKFLTGKTITIELDLNETIGSLKKKIEDKEGVPSTSQKLLFRTKAFENDNETCLDFGVEEEDTIFSCLRF